MDIKEMQSVTIDSHWVKILYTKREQGDVYFRVYSWAAMSEDWTPPMIMWRKKEPTVKSGLTQNLEEAEVTFQMYIRPDQSYSLCFGEPDGYWKDPWFTGESPWETEIFGVAIAKCWEIAKEELKDTWEEFPDND